VVQGRRDVIRVAERKATFSNLFSSPNYVHSAVYMAWRGIGGIIVAALLM